MYSITDLKKLTVKNSSILLSFFSQPELLKWTRNIVDATTSATLYDDKVDQIYNQTHIGGGNHRLFDESHTLGGIFEKVKQTYPDDNFLQEIIASVSVWFKDVTTPGGMPFINIDDKIAYDNSAKWFSENIPGATTKWFYDFHMYDIGEIFTSSLGIVCSVFAIKNNDRVKLEEILGSMSILSILTANPLMGVAVIVITCYEYTLKKKALDFKNITTGIFKSSLGLFIISLLGVNLIVHLVILMIVYKAFKKKRKFMYENIIYIWNQYIKKNYANNSILLLDKPK